MKKTLNQLQFDITLEEELNMIDKNISEMLKEIPEYMLDNELENEQESG